MKNSLSRIRHQQLAGQLSAVMKINLADPRVVEIAGFCGVDAVWLCTEHVPNDWLTLEGQIRAARVHGMDALVRVARGSYSDYIRPLEAGATGIIVPHVASAQEARQIVEWVRFQPLGKRALDGGNIDGAFCLLPTEEYVRQANDERLVILQIESPEALAEVEEIAAVPGFDGFLFGPGDFSHRIGKIGQINDPAVIAARRRVAAAARSHGKFAMAAGLFAPLAELVEEGHTLLGIGADVTSLGSTIKQRLETFRTQAETLPTTPKTAATSPYV